MSPLEAIALNTPVFQIAVAIDDSTSRIDVREEKLAINILHAPVREYFITHGGRGGEGGGAR